MKILKFLKNLGKKGQVASDRLVDKLLGVTIFVFIAAALVPILLTSFTNLSNSGIALAVLFTTVVGLLLAVAVFKGVQKGLKF